MKLRNLYVIALLCVLASAQTPKGTVPRSSADRYPAHAQKNDVAIGARLLSQKEAEKAFATEVNRCCVVIEVALYPQKDGQMKVSLNDFVLRVKGTDTATKPSSAQLLAAMLQKQAQPQSDHEVGVHPSVGVGYESGGYDPVTGTRRSGGIVTSAGVGVGVGSPAPKPGSTDRDRRTMELELGEKSLPEGSASTPISGYLYFSMPVKDRKAARQLEYTLNGEKLVLTLQ